MYLVACVDFLSGIKMSQAPTQTPTPRHELLHGDERNIGKSNLRIDLDKITCHPTCAIIPVILKNHFISTVLTNTSTVPEVYILQFWKDFKPSKDQKSITVRIDSRDIKFKVSTLRMVLGLQAEGSKDAPTFTNPPSLSEVVSFLRKLGYDESKEKITLLKTINRKYIPQPWLTLFAILTNSITGRQSGHEHPSLRLLQFFWGVINKANIDYAQLIWDDMLFQADGIKKQEDKKVPFSRFTKLLVRHFMNKYSDIDPRIDDKQHTPSMDILLSSARVQTTSTTKRGMRIPECLLTDEVRATEAYNIYDAAEESGQVGAKSWKVPPNRSKKVTRQPKRKLKLINEPDEPVPEEAVDETSKKRKTGKGKKIESSRDISPPLTASEEAKLLKQTLKESRRVEQERLEKMSKKGQGSSSRPETQPEESEQSDSNVQSESQHSSKSDETEQSSSRSIKSDKHDESESGDERVKESEDDESDHASDDDNADDEEIKKVSDEESEAEKNESESETSKHDDEQESDEEEGHTSSESESERESDDYSDTRVTDYQIVPIKPQTQTQHEPSTVQSQSQQVQTSSQKPKGPGPQKIRNRSHERLKKRLDDLEKEGIEKAVKDKIPSAVDMYLRDNLPTALESLLKSKLPELVSKTLQTTPMTLQTAPAKPTVASLKGQLLEAIIDDPEEDELRQALLQSMRKAELKDASCKQPKPSKRRRDDKDPDHQQPPKKRPSHGPSSSKPPTRKQAEKGTGSSQRQTSGTVQTDEAEVVIEMETPVDDIQVDEVPFEEVQIPTNVTEPPKDAQMLSEPEWIDPSAPSFNWFNEMVDAYPDIPETEEPIEGSVVGFAKRLKRVMKTQRLQLSDLLEIRRAGFTDFKTCTTNEIEFEYNVEEVARALSENINWEPRAAWDTLIPLTEDLKYQDFTKPLPLLGTDAFPRIPKEYFFNKDLKYLIHGNTDPDCRYSTSLTKFKAASYLIHNLHEQMRGLYCSTVSRYNDEASLGVLHWPERRRWFYKWKLSTCKTKGSVYRKDKILAITDIPQTENRFGYNFLEKIVVRRSDDKLHTFSEADFQKLNINDIEDMYVLKRQGRIQNLPGSLQYDFTNSLLLFIRYRILKARVEDVQLGAESYQTGLNLTEPEDKCPGIHEMRSYTFNNKPFGVAFPSQGRIYFMRYEETMKFGDETLRKVLLGLNDKLKKFNKGMNVGWKRKDAREAQKFIDVIRLRLKMRHHIRTLESLIGAREGIPNIQTYRRPDQPPL